MNKETVDHISRLKNLMSAVDEEIQYHRKKRIYSDCSSQELKTIDDNTHAIRWAYRCIVENFETNDELRSRINSKNDPGF